MKLAIFQVEEEILMCMAKLNGKVKTCVFISGRGSNLKSLIKSSKITSFPAKICLVISNKKNAKGIQVAKTFNIPSKIIQTKDKKKFELEVLPILKKKKIKLICLAGFMKILSDKFIKNFKYKILNIHPSLLPKYKGLNTHKKVLKNNDKFSGCTVHFVTKKLDSGKIILQKKVKINKQETVNSLKKKILKIEHSIYSKAIKIVLKTSY